ncbi:hypothetical protein [Citrobacter braakii]|uniref:hypothetical protein n=1 Tax=Citrobacter braakii TaxID=57706 RepID=UPI002B31EDC8|nr:hypothetical protein R0Q77_12990 [Citrobacter braakii]
MKLNYAKIKELAPIWMNATRPEKMELLKQYDITEKTVYNAMKRYNIIITKTVNV